MKDVRYVKFINKDDMEAFMWDEDVLLYIIYIVMCYYFGFKKLLKSVQELQQY